MQPTPVLLMVRALGIGGSERQMAIIAAALDRTRFEPHVACMYPEGLRAQELRDAGVPIFELSLRSFKSPAGLIQAAFALDRYIRRHGIRLVHSFDYPTSLFAAPALRLLHSPAVILSSQRSHRELYSTALHRLVRLTDKLVRGIVVNSTQLRQHLIEDEKISGDRIHLCYNGIALDLFQPPAAPVQRSGSLQSASVVIGVVCALRPEKDLATLVRAFALVSAADAGLRLLIVGDGPCKADLQTLASELGIEHQTVFIPAASNVVPWLHAIDIFVLPSTSEAFSNSLMEAMASGCAAVASRVGGNPELVHDDVTGLLFEKQNPSDLARCLTRLLADAPMRRRLGEAGSAFINSHFSIAAAAACMGSLYTELLAAKRR